MEKSESIKELAGALAKAQGEFAGAVKDTNNPFFKSKYADLESVVSAIKPHLAKNGLSFIQLSHNLTGCAAIETVILHLSGEWISCGITAAPVSKQDAQGYGSAMTYARRYSLSAAFGVAPEDDDGNAASKAPPKYQEQAPNFDAEIKMLRDCGSLDSLAAAWKKMDKPTQHALSVIKDECKAKIEAADKPTGGASQ